MRNNIFYIHTNIVTKKWGKTREKQFFQKHTIKNCWEKNRRKKVRKNVFYIHTNIVTKKWRGGNAGNNFSRNTRMVRAKMLGKKSPQKCAKKRFLYSLEYRDQKMVGKKSAKQFFQKHTNGSRKNVGKKSS